MVRHLAVRRSFAVMGCAFVAVSTCPYLVLAKPNSISSLFMLASYYTVIVALKNSEVLSNGCITAAVLFGVLATLAKQTGILVFVIIFAYLIMTRDWRKLLFAILTMLAAFGLAFVLMRPQLGPAIRANIVDGVDNGVDLLYVLQRPYKDFFTGYSFLLALSTVAVCNWLLPRARPFEKFLAICLSLNFAFAAVSALKVGSSLAYFHNFIMVAVIAVAYYLQGYASKVALREEHLPTTVTAVYLLCFLPIVTLLNLYEYGYGRTEAGSLIRSKADFQFSSWEPVVAYLRQECAKSPDSLVLSLEQAVTNLLPEHCIVPQKELARFAHERGQVDYSRLRSLLEDGTVRFVVFRRSGGQSDPEPFLGIPFDNYVHDRDFLHDSVYRFVGDSERHGSGRPNGFTETAN
jgi:hypothetical protein